MLDKKEQIDITFCLPVYNVKDFLKDCIDSIMNQKTKQITYEILCIDDCSTDGSYEYLLNFSKENSILRVLRNNKNSKISYTRNRLLDEAKGEYIWFIDPDDMIYADSVQYVFEEAQKRNADFLYCNYRRIEENFTIKQNFIFDGKPARLVLDKEDLPIDEEKRKMNAVWAGVFRRSFLLDNELRFNERMTMQEDAVFWWEFKQRTEKMYKIDSPVYLYRQRKSSLTHTASNSRRREQYFSNIEKFKVYKKYFHDKNFAKDRKILAKKIFLTRQGIVNCLVAFDDKNEIKNQLNILKKESIYPYKLSFLAFCGKGSVLKKMLSFLLPLKPFFWLSHFMYKRKKRKNIEVNYGTQAGLF